MPETMEKICRTCKFSFSFPMAEATFPCPTCGAVNGRPKAQGASGDHLKHATRQRLACDFHNAEISYQHVLLDHPDEHEAHWGLVLCRYGVEYVEDPRTGKPSPTVRSVRKKPMQTDHHFLAACEYAPEEVRAQYEVEAQYIDDAMARIRKLAETQQPYDVFICHKKRVPGSENLTPEYGKAAEMAHSLMDLGYRVFFAPESIKGELGADYEAAIYHALDTAKVMLMFCANEEYVTSAWVRSEWTRFLEMTLERDDKRLVPLLYGDFTAEKLPRELRPYRPEYVTMDSFTAASDILRLLEKFCGKRGAEGKPPEEKKPAPKKAAAARKPAAEKKPAPAEPPEEKKPAPKKAAAARKPAAEKKPAPAEPAEEKKPAPKEAAAARKPAAEKKPEPAKPTVKKQPVPSYASEADFETKAVDGGCAITKYKGQGGEVNVPPTIGGQKVVEIGEDAFKDCRSLTRITLPEGVTSLGSFAFKDCRSLTRITLPEGVTSLGSFAFEYCSSLTSITLPESIRKVGVNPFVGCEKLRVISVPPSHKTLSVVGGVLFSKDGKRLICYPCALTATHYDVPLGVTSIGAGAFGGCHSLTSITLPKGVTSIGDVAFRECSSLTSITLPDSVTSIGYWAFEGCSSLMSVSLPEQMIVSSATFDFCVKLKPENIVRRPRAEAEKPAPAQPASIYAPESDFETEPVPGGCAIRVYKGKGGDVKIPSTIGGLQVVAIGNWTFEDCRNLTSITLPKGVTNIGESAFYGCSSLTSITLPESLTSIGCYAFMNCSSLTSISLPEGVTSIGDMAFHFCSSLTSITLPKGVTSIGNGAFSNCRSLTSITLPKGVTSIGVGTFSHCRSLTSIKLPEGVTSIGSCAFYGCISLKSITLPKGLDDIGASAFAHCSKLPLSLKLKLKLKGAM